MRDIYKLLEKYRGAAAGTGASSGQNNRCAKKLNECYQQLRTSEEGRKGLLKLASDPNPLVRCWAAAHSLEWSPSFARAALEALRDSDGPGAFSAKWTLIEYDKGTLRFPGQSDSGSSIS